MNKKRNIEEGSVGKPEGYNKLENTKSLREGY
jgi:hypothetical protein